MERLKANAQSLRKTLRHEYKRIVAFMLTVAMVVTNFGTNLTVAFAAGEEESSLFLLESSELEDAISAALESGDVFDFSSLELKAKQKSLKTSYEKLIGTKAGKVYQLDVDVDSSYAAENTDLQVFYNAGTDSVVFLFINESDMAVTFRANVSGYETARVTVNPNTSNIEDAADVNNAEDYSNTTMVDDEKNQAKAEVVKTEEETSEAEETAAAEETEAEAETKAEAAEGETASAAEETAEAEKSAETEETAEAETTAAEETETVTETEETTEAAEETEAETEVEALPEEGSASASISRKEVFRVSTNAKAAEESLEGSVEEETKAEEPEKETEAEAPEKETEALPETTAAEETAAKEETKETTAAEETIAEESKETEETTAADETAAEESKADEETTAAEETKAAEETPAADESKATEETAADAADNSGNADGYADDEQFLEDDTIEAAGELNGKAYNTVTIWGSANARAYAVKAEDLVGKDAVDGEYNVDYSVDPVGAASFKGADSVEEGKTLYFAVEPQVGYEISEVTANGEILDEIDAAEVASASNLQKYEHVYAVEDVTEDLEIVASMSESLDVAHPEFNASYESSDGVTISLHAEEGILPEGTELQVTEVTEALGDTIKEKVEGESEGTAVNAVLAYDINLLYNGKKLSNSWSEQGYVDVTFTGAPIQEMSESSDKVEIVAVDDTSSTKLSAENAEEVKASELKLESVSEQNVEGTAVEEVGFKAEHFTIYTVTFLKNNVSDPFSLNAHLGINTEEGFAELNIAMPNQEIKVADSDVSIYALIKDLLKYENAEYNFVKATAADNYDSSKITSVGVGTDGVYASFEDGTKDKVTNVYLWYEAEMKVSVKIYKDNIASSDNLELSQGLLEAPEFDGYDFIEAKVGDHQVNYLRRYNNQIYWAYVEDTSAGTAVTATLLEADQSIALYYETHVEKYQIKTTVNNAGNEDNKLTECPESIKAGKGFNLKLNTARGYTVTVAVNGTTVTGSTDGIYEVSAFTAAPQTGNEIDVRVTYTKVNKYSYSVANTADAHWHNATWSVTKKTKYTAGQEFSFTVETAKGTNEYDWQLNSFQINGEDVKVPTSYDVNASAETTLKTGTKITIKLESNTKYNIYDRSNDLYQYTGIQKQIFNFIMLYN